VNNGIKFREEILPGISSMCSDSSVNVFPSISAMDICWYLVDKGTHRNKYVNGVLVEGYTEAMGTRSEAIDIIQTVRRSPDFHSITELGSIFIPSWGYFWSVMNIASLSSDVFDDSSDYFFCDTKSKVRISPAILRHISDADKYSLSTHGFINPTFVSYIRPPYECEQGAHCTLYVGSEQECLYAQSYFKCKLVRYLTSGVFGEGINSSTKYWVNVPSPAAYDHYYTDVELYAKYELSSKQVAVIESVIPD